MQEHTRHKTAMMQSTGGCRAPRSSEVVAPSHIRASSKLCGVWTAPSITSNLSRGDSTSQEQAVCRRRYGKPWPVRRPIESCDRLVQTKDLQTLLAGRHPRTMVKPAHLDARCRPAQSAMGGAAYERHGAWQSCCIYPVSYHIWWRREVSAADSVP